MMDKPLQRRERDISQIDLSKDYEVRFWTAVLRVTEDELRLAVQVAGNSAKAVREYLGKH